MKRWALVTILLYAAILVLLVIPVMFLAFWPKADWRWVQKVYEARFFWACPLGLMMLCQAAFLALPVRLAQERPVTRTPVFWTILAAAVMLLVLVAGMCLVAWETIFHLSGNEVGNEVYDITAGMATVVLVGCFWAGWAFLFGFYAGRRQPQEMMPRLVRWLIAGSILELVIAVPAHVYGRMKDSCCGGLMTVWGLAAGIAVGLFAFGPGVFLLFVRRLRSIQSRHGK